METDLAQLADSLAKLSDQIGALVSWMKILTGALAGSLFVGLAVLHQIVSVKRWQTEYAAPLARLAAEQRARASHERTVAARRASRTDSDQPPH